VKRLLRHAVFLDAACTVLASLVMEAEYLGWSRPIPHDCDLDVVYDRIANCLQREPYSDDVVLTSDGKQMTLRDFEGMQDSDELSFENGFPIQINLKEKVHYDYDGDTLMDEAWLEDPASRAKRQHEALRRERLSARFARERSTKAKKKQGIASEKSTYFESSARQISESSEFSARQISESSAQQFSESSARQIRSQREALPVRSTAPIPLSAWVVGLAEQMQMQKKNSEPVVERDMHAGRIRPEGTVSESPSGSARPSGSRDLVFSQSRNVEQHHGTSSSHVGRVRELRRLAD